MSRTLEDEKKELNIPLEFFFSSQETEGTCMTVKCGKGKSTSKNIKNKGQKLSWSERKARMFANSGKKNKENIVVKKGKFDSEGSPLPKSPSPKPMLQPHKNPVSSVFDFCLIK